MAAHPGLGRGGPAISATGSTTPCAYDGAEQATSTVSGRIAAAIVGRRRAQRVRVDTGTDVERDPQVVRRLGERRVRARRHHHPGAAISGWASRAALTARISDSVPPLVTLPTTSGAAVPGPPPSSPAGRADQRVLHGQQGREGGRVEPVDVRALPAWAAAASSSSPGTAGS